MAEMTAEKFAQRAFDCDLIDAHRLESVWGEFGSRDVPLEEFTGLLVRKELLTNFQVERILTGKRDGYFYGNYKVLYLVGAGTFARVYRAVHRDTGRIVAVKVLRQRYMDDALTTERFMREARMVMPLRHPNIVPIYEVLTTKRGRTYMVMEFVEGQNLRDFIRVRRGLDMDQSMRLIRDVVSALEYALSQGVTHRDMKLSNVLISSQGRAKLVDFGLAAVSADMSDDQLLKSNENPRSIDYAGLERATGVRKNDPRSDIYFAGCMLYHMIAGRAPLHETRDRIQRLAVGRYRDIKPLTEYVEDVPGYVIALINKAIEFKPDRRFQTPTEMLAEIKVVTKRWKAGDLGTAPPEAEEEEQQGVAEEAAETTATGGREGDERTVMIVESSPDAQNAFRKSLKKRGYRVLVTNDPERALQRFADHDHEGDLADCVVFSAQELGQPAVEAFNEFSRRESTQHIPAVLLVDPSKPDLAEQATTDGQHVMLKMPVTLKQLRGLLLQLIGPNGRPE